MTNSSARREEKLGPDGWSRLVSAVKPRKKGKNGVKRNEEKDHQRIINLEISRKIPTLVESEHQDDGVSNSDAMADTCAPERGQTSSENIRVSNSNDGALMQPPLPPPPPTPFPASPPHTLPPTPPSTSTMQDDKNNNLEGQVKETTTSTWKSCLLYTSPSPRD